MYVFKINKIYGKITYLLKTNVYKKQLYPQAATRRLVIYRLMYCGLITNMFMIYN